MTPEADKERIRDTANSTGAPFSPSQAVSPQAWDSVDPPVHSEPPFCEVFVTNLDRSRLPPSHVAEQTPHWLQGLHWQLTEKRGYLMCDVLWEGIAIKKQLLRLKRDN